MDSLSHLVSYSWIIFGLYWIVAATSAKQDARVHWSNNRWLSLIFFAVLMVVLFVPYAGTHELNHQIASHSPVLKALGLVLFYGGLTVAIWARRHLGNNWGAPMSVKADLQLVTSGPYRWVRHPIYTGLLLALLGSMLVKDLSWLLFFVAAAIYAIYSSIQEEKLLARQLPKTYSAYKRRTKMLVPYII